MPPPVRDGPDAPIPGFPASLQPNFPSEGTNVSKRVVVARRSSPKVKPERGAGRWKSLYKQWGQDGYGEAGKGWQNGKQTGSGCGPEECRGLPGRELILPPYMIQNGAGPTLADGTTDTDLIQFGGYTQYDSHNLYGAMMSSTSQQAMLARRPSDRAMVITRSTFAGSGKDVSHWLGDNLSEWEQYRFSISQILQFAALYQVPLVGSDVCGFGGNVTETLCARWASLGAFYTFYRNHAEISSTDQEFYRWSSVTRAAQNAISIRYQLLDYIYTAMYKQNQTGLPLLNPLFFNYENDENTYPIDLQFFFGEGILVSPVTVENSTRVDYYLPDDIFYEWGTGKPVRGEGAFVTANVELEHITLHYKGGVVYPQRVTSANTTTALRTKGFNIVVAPGLDGEAKGSLYLDDGISNVQEAVSEIDFEYKDGVLCMTGSFEYDAGISIEMITVLGVEHAPDCLEGAEYDEENKKLVVHVDVPLTGKAEIGLA